MNCNEYKEFVDRRELGTVAERSGIVEHNHRCPSCRAWHDERMAGVLARLSEDGLLGGIFPLAMLKAFQMMVADSQDPESVFHTGHAGPSRRT